MNISTSEPPKPVAKQPWEMTKAKFLVDFSLERGDMDFVEHGGCIERIEERAFKVHRRYIEKAITSGKIKSHPDYPDLRSAP